MTHLKSLRRDIKALEPDPINKDLLMISAVEAVLDSSTPEDAAAFEDAMQEQVALGDAGFSEAEIATMLRPETLGILQDLKTQVDALLPQIKKEQAELYRRCYRPGVAVVCQGGGEDAD